MKKLQDKIKEVREDFAEEKATSLVTDFDQLQRDKANQILGGLQVGGRLLTNISNHISSELVKGLTIFQEENLYRYFGFENFAAFLNNSGFELPNKTDFYERKKLLENEGTQIYDIFNEAKIKVSTRKLLAEHNGANIIIDGDKLIIGDEEIATTDTDTIKEVIKSLAAEIRVSTEKVEKQDSQIGKLKSELDTGKKEYDELRRNFDAMKEGSPFDRSFSDVINALIQFNDQVKQLPEEAKADKSENCLDTIWTLFNETRERFGSNRNFYDGTALEGLSDIAAQVLTEDDDFGDEYEQ